MVDALTSAKGSLYIQRHAYDTPEYVGAVSLDTLVEALGDITVVQARSFDSYELETAITARSSPGGIPVSITALTFPARDLIDLIGDCEVTLYVTQDCQGRHGVLDAYDRCYILHHVALSKITRDGLAHMTADIESTRKLDFIAGTPIYLVGHVESLVRVATTSADNWLDVAQWRFRRCSGPRGYEQEWCQYMVAITDVPGGPGTAKVWYSRDGGDTWTITAADPYAAGVEIGACAIFPVHEDTIRLLVVRHNTETSCCYSDDWGANWTTVVIDTATVGTEYPNALFYLDGHNIWLAEDTTSTVYVSYTGGETWETLGTVTEGIRSLWFSDPNNGYAGATNGVIYRTTNGGLTWTQAVDTGAGHDWRSIYAFDTKHVIAGVGSGNVGVYVTFDGWATYSAPTFYPALSATARIYAIEFYNPFCGFIVYWSGAGPNVYRIYWTMDGGLTWHGYDTDYFLVSMEVCGPESALAVGYVDAGTATIVKTSSA